MVLYVLRKHKMLSAGSRSRKTLSKNTKVMSRGKKELGKGVVSVWFGRTDSHEGAPALSRYGLLCLPSP